MNNDSLLLVESIASSIDGTRRYASSCLEDTYEYFVHLEDARNTRTLVRIPKHLVETNDMASINRIVRETFRRK